MILLRNKMLFSCFYFHSVRVPYKPIKINDSAKVNKMIQYDKIDALKLINLRFTQKPHTEALF